MPEEVPPAQASPEMDGLRSRGVFSEETQRHSDSVAIPVGIEPKAGGIFRWGLFGCFGMLAGTGVLIVVVSLVVAMANAH